MKGFALGVVLVLMPFLALESDAFSCVDVSQHVGTWTNGVDDHECTGLVKEKCTGLKCRGCTTQVWRPGTRVEENCGIERLTAIATFYDGRYPIDRSGHAAIFDGCEGNSIWVYDQNNDHPIKRTRFYFNAPGAKADNGSNYYVITF